MIYNKFLIIILFLLFILLSSLFPDFLFSNKNNEIKVCVCSPVKKENLYLKEFIEHYKSYNVDKIFLYDNNDLDGEYLENVINQYTQTNYVEIINFRGKKKALYYMMNDCYKNNYLNYDWFIFYEIDEFINLKNYSDIKKFLNEDKFNRCQTIQLNWLFHTDNDKIYYEDRPLKIRFSTVAKFVRTPAIKSILRGNISNLIINCVHKINNALITCDGFGNITHLEGAVPTLIDYEYNYIDHYFCKSTEEFINKINKGDVLYNLDNFIERLKVYFAINKINKEKIYYVQKNLNMNISWKKIINNYSDYITRS